jgi:phenylalanyl-tRNA synthetase beta chain
VRVPFGWLTEYCDPGLAPEEVAGLLSMRAIEVERVSRVGVPQTDGFVVGRVIVVEPHPDADRLRVCEVETGDGSRTIVCGAPNVAAGQAVAVALPGARMPDGQTLEKASLRGVESNGMILSERELDLGDDHEGILVLREADPGTDPAAPGREAEEAAGLVPGTPLAEVLPIADSVLELDLNPNRVDCMAVYGVARELHAITGTALAPPPWEAEVDPSGEGSVSELASVMVEVPDLCPRFTARAFTDVVIGPSPAWLRARLIAAGMRPISNVVDVTNYVMLMTAQPLHAFDLDKLPGGEVIVRTARDGERMTTLDGVERSFDAETVLVCDRDRPSGIAGIMGGQVSEVSEATTRVLLEAATWDGLNILRTSSLLGLRSDASARFEKQLHPELALGAQRIAARLLVELAGARLVPGTIDVAVDPPAAHVISLRGARCDSLLGVHVERSAAAEGLGRLGFAVEDVGERDLSATVPIHRHYDVTREVDLIEEVGRLHGFDRLPRTLPGDPSRAGGLSREQTLRRRAEDVLRDLGYDQVTTWAFVDGELADRLRLAAQDPGRVAVAVANPISEEHAQMRTTLLGGLLDAARHNLARNAERVAIFESARAYLRSPAPEHGGPFAGRFAGRLPAPAREPHRVAALLVGELAPASWRGAASAGDASGFYALKGTIEVLAAQLGTEVALAAEPQPFLHPGRAAGVSVRGFAAGWIGELHPLVARAWDLPTAAGFELDLAPLLAGSRLGEERFEDVTTFPAVLQDLAVTVPEEVPAERVRAAVGEGGGALLAGAEVFDLYRGEQLGEGRKSLALRLEFRAKDRTLTDAEVGELRERIRAELDRIGGSLRE